MLGLVSAFYWLATPKQDLAPPIEAWLGIPALLLPLYVACQLIPLPASVLRIISPERAALLDRLAHVGEKVRFAPISITPEITSTYLFRIIAYTIVFLLVRELSWHSRKQRSYAPLFPLIATAAIEAAFGIFQNANGADTVEGTYGNKNHFAGLLEMALPFAIALALALIDEHRRSSHHSPVSRLIAGVGALLIGATIIVGLVVSISKMGYVAALAGLLVIAALGLGTMLAGWQRWLGVTLMVAGFTFVLVFLPSDQLMRAFGGFFADDWTTGEGRWPIFGNALGLIRAYPLVGCGLGNFQTGFLKFQTEVIDRAFTFAHNDYLQLASELGIVGFAITAVLMFGIAWKVFWSIQGPDRMNRCFGLGCIGAMTAIGLHSFVDFNTYIPANAFVLAWIAGIAASLSTRTRSWSHADSVLNCSLFRNTALLSSAVLIVFASAWIVFESHYYSEARTERLFCRFGICDTDAVQQKQAAALGGNIAALPTSELVLALGRDPASPVRWCDLGEAFAKRGQLEQARFCFSTALELGPYLPIALTRAAEFHLQLHQENLALQENARILEKTATYDDSIFDWYRTKNIPVARVLSDGLPENRRAYQAYLRYWIMLGKFDDAAAVWDWTIARGYVDQRLAREYVNFLFNGGRYEAAAKAWARYLGDHRDGYLESDWLYNGDFESKPEGLALDWRLDGVSENVEVARDPAVAHTGLYSLRIHFLGNANVNFGQTYETAFVTPGTYRFEACVRTEKITTDEGIGFEISSGTTRLDIKTEKLIGTNDWKNVEQVITIPRDGTLLTIRVVRRPSLKFDSFISGTAWIDSVRLERTSAQ